MFLRAMVVASCLLASAIADDRRPFRMSEADRVRAVAQELIAADNTRDLDRVMAVYADDAILMPPNEAPVRGKVPLRPRYKALFDAMQPEIESRIEEIQVTGDWAYVVGSNGGRLVPLAGGEPRRLSDAYVMILRRDHGAWSVARLIWHSTEPLKAPAK